MGTIRRLGTRNSHAFARDPGLVWGWHEWRRAAVLRAAPNSAHHAIAQLEMKAPHFTLVTQNVDDLHERAGSRNILHLHGEIKKPYCERCYRRHAPPAAIPDLPPGGARFTEFSEHFEAFVSAGAQIIAASPRGGTAPVDPRGYPSREDIASVRDALAALNATTRFGKFRMTAVDFWGGEQANRCSLQWTRRAPRRQVGERHIVAVGPDSERIHPR